MKIGHYRKGIKIKDKTRETKHEPSDRKIWEKINQYNKSLRAVE